MAIDAINKFMPFLGRNQAVNPIREKQAEPNNGVQQFQPMAPVSNNNPFGISIPGQVGYVNGLNGEKISMGQDGVGLAHKNKLEHPNMWIA